MRSLLCVMALSALVPNVAASKMIFTPHHGAPDVMRGEGGKSIRSHGITVWTRGMPSSDFRVIGVIEDEHTEKTLATRTPKSLVSAAIADLVRARGGDAVLVRASAITLTDVERRSVSGTPGTNAFSDQGDVLVHDVASRLVVIKSTG